MSVRQQPPRVAHCLACLAPAEPPGVAPSASRAAEPPGGVCGLAGQRLGGRHLAAARRCPAAQGRVLQPRVHNIAAEILQKCSQLSSLHLFFRRLSAAASARLQPAPPQAAPPALPPLRPPRPPRPPRRAPCWRAARTAAAPGAARPAPASALPPCSRPPAKTPASLSRLTTGALPGAASAPGAAPRPRPPPTPRRQSPRAARPPPPPPPPPPPSPPPQQLRPGGAHQLGHLPAG